MKRMLCIWLAVVVCLGGFSLTAWAADGDAVDTGESAQDVTPILQATMAQLAATVSEPSFGTLAGEWTVFCLARGGYFDKNDPYFTDYYNRIEETVNETATKVNLNGGLHKSKSTENSRLIVALSAIGKDATDVGGWDLVEAYSANGINWIRKQGMNGTIWTLIALDSGNYETSDPTIRQQCVDAILAGRHNDGGWSLVTAKAQPSNVDITCMTLTALYPYRDQEAVATACAEAIEWLSASQLSTGGFPYGNGETSESCAWAIVALTMWGIDPDTDERFIKDGISALDNLLTYYVVDEAMFEHGKGAGSNAMATDQACYALVAYDRFIKGETALYDYSDVTFGDLDVPGEETTTAEDVSETETVTETETDEENTSPETTVVETSDETVIETETTAEITEKPTDGTENGASDPAGCGASVGAGMVFISSVILACVGFLWRKRGDEAHS